MEDGKAVNKLRVLYEDNHVIVVVKEKNVLSQADNTHDIDMLTIIKKYLKENIINLVMFIWDSCIDLIDLLVGLWCLLKLVKLPVDYLIKFEKRN